MSNFIDLTRTLYHEMPVFPGEKSPAITLDKTIATDGYNGFRLESNMHSGTHMDAPMHVQVTDRTIDSFDAGLFTGKACVIDVRGLKVIRYQPEWEAKFAGHDIVLFRTGHDRTWDTPAYYGEYPDFESLIAGKLVENGVRIAGFDSPSPDRMPYDFHLVFLHDERFLIESLTNLGALPDNSSFRLYAFPLKVRAEASLVRVVAEI
ncbi:MAG TPA: cyclase family protein [Bacteroidales bacterium]|nr:cyclase family protein [Bacteroidales bacterium]HPT01886.1 cyclase family protein [Bacteroidales bacterium]